MRTGTINILKTDGGISFQRELIKKSDSVTDLSKVRGVRFCGEIKDFLALKAKLGPIKPGITFLGTGDFHHLCLYFLNKVSKKPQLLLFDHHSDMMEPLPGTISCGSWVKIAMRRGKVKKCIIVGVNPKDEAFTGSSEGDRVAFFPENIPHEKKVSGVMEELLKFPDPVYISIDKDVLAPEEAFTNWDQGSMTLDEVIDFLKIIKRAKNIVGADICGEWPVPPDEIFHTSEDFKRVKINQQTNLKILKALLK